MVYFYQIIQRPYFYGYLATRTLPQTGLQPHGCITNCLYHTPH